MAYRDAVTRDIQRRRSRAEATLCLCGGFWLASSSLRTVADILCAAFSVLQPDDKRLTTLKYAAASQRLFSHYARLYKDAGPTRLPHFKKDGRKG